MTTHTRTVIGLMIILSLVLVPPTSGYRPTPRAGEASAVPLTAGPFRAHVTLSHPTARTRLDSVGVVVLTEGPGWALVLADDEQLETLARLRFEPRATDDLGLLVEAHAQEKPWLKAAVQPLLDRAAKVRELAGAARETQVTARTELRVAMHTLTSEQQAGIASLSSVDDDADGLTNTQEQWWCTDPMNPDSDGDGVKDGDEVVAARDWLANRRSGPPSSGKPFAGWPPQIPGCRDDDQDSVPDMAERWELGLNMNRESTDRDKFDDGQELFGNTYCPGSGGYCGYGALPRNEDWGIIFAEMPSWVEAPGNHPLVAAFPVPEVDVVPSSLHVVAVTTVTTDHTISQGTERSYSTAKTEGTSSSVADTVTWNEWQEVSLATPLGASLTTARLSGFPPYDPNRARDIEAEAHQYKTSAAKWNAFSGLPIIGIFPGLIGQSYEALSYVKEKELHAWERDAANKCDPNAPYWAPKCFRGLSEESGHKQTIDSQKPTTETQDRVAGSSGLELSVTATNELIIKPVIQVDFPMQRQVPVRTETSGHSWGGARTTAHTTYEEHTITNGEAFSSGESWGTATAVDSAHAADLWFTYKVRNTGTEYAREIANLAFNIYIGDDPNPVYTYFVGPDLGGDGKFHNFMPGEEHTYTARHIPLNLDQMRAVDLGGPIRIVVEDFTYGIDELFYQDAVNAGVLIALEDSTDDGDETIDTYLIPTWGTETVLDVLARYFPHTTDADGNLIAIWTPEYRSDTPTWCNEPQRVGATLWCKHALSTADWWNVYTSGLGDGSEGFQDTPATPGSVALFRFNKDSDLDGYSDRSEERLGSDPNDPASYPRPELIAGVHSIRVGNAVTATLSLLNTGLYDAYGVEAVMIAPDDSVSITNNTVGGSGRVRAQKQVIVGSRILLQSPLPPQWTQSGHAMPAAGGYYTGQADRTYTFTVQCGNPGGCDVGAGAWTLAWNDGAGNNGTLNFGAGYASPTFQDVGALGVKLALYTGKVYNGESFTVEARTPRDTFQYIINREPYTEPVVIVSYNDPQGNHRFVTPVRLSTPTENLASYSGQMLPDPGVEIVTTAPFTVGVNTVNLVVNNPTDRTLTDAHLFLEFVNITGTVVSEIPVTVTLPPGPTVQPVTFDVSRFTPPYQADQDYIVMAFWTDYQGNILDTAARPLSSFQADPRPAFAMAETDEVWDFGTVTQGTILERTFTFANIGFLDLLTYVSAPAGMNLSQQGTRRLSPADATTYEITLDTNDLSVGPYDETITIRTSDPASPTRTVHVVGMIQAVSGQACAFSIDRYRPWDEGVFILGGHQAREQIDFSDFIATDPSTTHPLYVYDFAHQTKLGVGKKIALVSQQLGGTEMAGIGLEASQHSVEQSRLSSTASMQSSPPWWNDSYLYRRQLTVNANSAINTNYYAKGIFNLGALPVRADRNDVRIVFWNGSSYDELDRIIINDAEWYFPVDVNIAAGSSNNNFWLYYGNPSAGIAPADWGKVLVPRRDAYTSALIYYLNQNTSDWSGHGLTYVTHPAWTWNAGGKYGWARRVSGHRTTGEDGENISRVWLGRTFTVEGWWLFETNMGYPPTWGDTGQVGTTWYPHTWGHMRQNGTLLLGIADDSYATTERADMGVSLQTNQWYHLAWTFNNDTRTGCTYVNGNYNWCTQFDRNHREGYAWIGMMTYSTGANEVIGTRISGIRVSSGIARTDFSYAKITQDPTVSVGPEISHTGTISGRVFKDLNNNGVQDGGEPGIGGVTVNLNGTGQSHTTNSNGDFSFTEVNPGNYTVSVVVPAGYVNTTPTSHTISLDPGSTAMANFGLLPYTVEKLSGTDHSIRLFSPESFAEGRRYWLQFGREVFLGEAGSQVVYVRLPKCRYSDVAMDIILAQAGSNSLSLSLDVGDDGYTDWTYSGSPGVPGTLTSRNLASAFNAFLAGQPSDYVDVPIRVSLGTSGQMFLSNLVAVPTIDKDITLTTADIAFGASSPTEGETVPITATLHNTATLDSGPLTAAFFATAPGWGQWYIGSAFVSNIPAGGTAQASISWNTLGFTGDVAVRVVADPFNRLTETSETNNVATATLTIRTRPDLQVTGIALSNDEPVAGETVTVTLTLRNNGQTTAGAQTVALYQGNPDAGGTVVGTTGRSPIPGGGTDTVAFTWTPTTPGPYRLFARVDQDNAVNEYDEGNNDAWLEVYVGLHGPILLDSGGTTDVAYTPERGYGYVDEGQPDVTTGCGSQAYETLRLDPGGRVVYRFAHLLPGHFYHLDLTLYECDGASRQESIYVDGNLIAGPEDLSDGRVHRLSLRLDPALYADRGISVTVQAPGIDGAVVGEVNLHDIDYRYADAGGQADPQYPGGRWASLGRPYGWLEGVPNTAWGTLPYQSVRVNQGGNTLRYRFDGLNPTRQYQVNLTFWQPSGTARIQKVQIDGADTGLTVNTGDYQVHRVTVDVPAGAYASDGSIIVGIVRTNASTGAFVNEIALEELTAVLPPVADFTASPTEGYAPLTVQFTDRSSGAITGRSWAFGDGGSDTVPNPVHTYNNPGVYTVTLTVSGPGGSHTLTRPNYITVTSIPVTATVVYIDPFTASANPGVPITVAVAISNVTNLGSFQFTLGYSPTLVTVQNITLGEFPGSTGRSFTPVGPSIDNNAGTATFGAFSLGATPAGPSGSGVLAYVRLLPQAGGTAALVLSGVQVANVSGQSIQVITRNGTLLITACLGDFDGDGDVDILDVQRIAYRWNTRRGDALYEPAYDVDSDGDIDILDVQQVAYRWGTRCGQAAGLEARPTQVQTPVALSVQPYSRTVTVGQVFTVGIVVSDVVDLGGFEFTLAYSPTVVQVVSATVGAFPGSTGRTFIPLGPNVDSVAGTVSFGAFSLGTTPPGASGSGTLAVLTLRALAEGESGLLFRSAQVSDRAGSPQPVGQMAGGLVSVGQGYRVYLPLVLRDQ